MSSFWPSLKFHTFAAIVVLILAVIWVATGEFSSVGSAAEEEVTGPAADGAGSSSAASRTITTNDPDRPPPNAESNPQALRTVAFIRPQFIDHQRVVRLSGVTEADKQATLAARTSGVIAQLPARAGASVQQGDVVVLLDGEDKQAQVETARAVLSQRQKEYDAVARLVKSGSSATLDADTARSALATARAQLKQADSVLDKLQVVVPFPGVLDDVLVEPGSYVQDGAPVATLLQLDPIIARGEISERDIGVVAPGSQAAIRLISGRRFQGTVRYISRQGSSRTRTFPVEVEIANPQLDIPAGMTSEIILQGAPVSSVLLPRSVVTLSDNGELGVRTLDPDNRVGFVPIDLIDDTPDGLYLAGIAPNARIIVAGQDLVSDGDRVEAVEAAR